AYQGVLLSMMSSPPTQLPVDHIGDLEKAYTNGDIGRCIDTNSVFHLLHYAYTKDVPNYPNVLKCIYPMQMAGLNDYAFYQWLDDQPKCVEEREKMDFVNINRSCQEVAETRAW